MALSQTQWKWRGLFAIRVQDKAGIVQDAKAILAGGIESPDDQTGAFDAIRLSANGEEPATWLATNTALKADMRDGLVNLVNTYPQIRYVIFANTELPQHADNAIIATNVAQVEPLIGQQFDFQQLLGIFGLQQIVEDNPI